MNCGKVLKFSVAVVMLAGIVHAGVYRNATRPACRSGLPNDIDYQFGTRSRSVESLSKTALLLRQAPPFSAWSPAEVATEPIGGYYQLSSTKLQIDHCAISRVALRVYPNGYWALDLRATQNVEFPPDRIYTPGGESLRQRDRFTLHLKRNEFFVVVRGYGGFPNIERRRDKSPGKPVLFCIAPESFWVQRGEPYDLHVDGCSEEVRDSYRYVDRVELEFYYR